MANGGWYGTDEEWQRVEAQLVALDSTLATFAEKHDFALTKNARDWPERSLRKLGPNDVNFLIQVFWADQEALTFNFWVCASQDGDGERYWNQEMIMEKADPAVLRERLSALLDVAKARLDDWSAHPEVMEFATKLAPLPK